MFSVTVDDKEYEVNFRHYNPVIFRKAIWGTDCYIETEEGLFVRGRTILHPFDVHSYNKNTGRKMSLYRALHNAFPGEDSKETRRKFWQAYYEARGGKW